jgi:hypothetical protein
MQRKLSLGGIFLLFLFFAIISCIHHSGTTSTEDTILGTEDIISSIEDLSSTEDISSTENKISTEDTITWPEDTFICIAVIDGDTFKLGTGKQYD